VCRKPFQIPSAGVIGLPHNFFIQGLLDDRGITRAGSTPGRGQSGDRQPCQVCLDDESAAATGSGNPPAATKYCVDCDQKLCERCSAPHRRWRGGGHEVKELGPELERDLLLQPGASYCEKHADKRVELYCFRCQKNICLLCSALKHSDHKKAAISELAVGLKSSIDCDNRQVAARIDEIRWSASQVGAVKSQFLADAGTLCDDIREAGEAAKRTIDGQVRHRSNDMMCLHSCRWLVETPSRDVEHYHMFTASRSPDVTILCHPG